ncbi:ankyrin repeat-containing domain protein [Lactarius sanguifluus]|nr:ankyrin repeat-containing domain protein [Lactarius sanguifluus]
MMSVQVVSVLCGYCWSAVQVSTPRTRTTTPRYTRQLSGGGSRSHRSQVLLKCGANPNAKNKWGETPLHLLSPGKYYPQEHGVDIARLLLERGADANAPDKDQFTPFYFASYFRRFDIAQLLLEYGLKDAEPSSQGTKRKADDVTVGSRSEKMPKLHEDAPRAMGTRTLHQP